MMKSKTISLKRSGSKKTVSQYQKHHELAKVLFGAAHWVVAHEASTYFSGATIHELSCLSGLRHELVEFIVIDLHRAKLGFLRETVYVPFDDAKLNVTIERISSAEFAGRLNRALNGSGRVVADECGAADPMET